MSFRTDAFPEEAFVLSWKVLIDVVFKSIKADDRIRYGSQGKLLHYFIFEGPNEGMFRLKKKKIPPRELKCTGLQSISFPSLTHVHTEGKPPRDA